MIWMLIVIVVLDLLFCIFRGIDCADMKLDPAPRPKPTTEIADKHNALVEKYSKHKKA